MKIKTLFVAPYATMKNLIENSASEQDELDVHIEIGNLQEGVEIARKAEKQGYEVIISRGGTAKLIQDEVGIPVIDVHVSGYDMLRVLTLANDFNGKKQSSASPTLHSAPGPSRTCWIFRSKCSPSKRKRRRFLLYSG